MLVLTLMKRTVCVLSVEAVLMEFLHLIPLLQAVRTPDNKHNISN